MHQLTVPAVPFVVTMVVSLLLATYMLFDPAHWLYDLMQLTYLPHYFKVFLLALAIGGFAVSYVAERFMFPPLARLIGKANTKLRPSRKKRRKEYKVVAEEMRF